MRVRADLIISLDGFGTTVDDAYARRYFEGIGAEIMGAGMFGLHLHPDDPDGMAGGDPTPGSTCPCSSSRTSADPRSRWRRHRVPLPLRDPQEALELASAAARGRDVRIAGGPSVVRDFLGLVDQLHVAIAPILLGRGIRLWDELRGLERGYQVTAEGAESGTAHVTFTRPATDGGPPDG